MCRRYLSRRSTGSPEPAIRLAERDKNPVRSAPQAPSVVTSWARAIVQALEARGLDGAALAERAGVPPEAIARADGRAPVSATGRLWRRAVAETGDPAFGVFASRFMTFPTFQALGVAVLASASVKDAFHRLVRYSRIISDAAEYRLEDAGDRYRLFLDVAPAARLEDESVDAIMSLAVRTIRALYSDRSVGPLRVALRRPEPPSTEAYRKFFRAPVTFAAARNVLELSRELVEAPLPSGQAELARHSDQVMSRALLQIDPQNLAQRVRGIVLDHLVDGEPTQASVARKLGVGLRTLQRRLAEEETSFADIVTQTRRDLAIGYLGEQGWSVTEVAFSLGFADVSSFSRAFRRWTGVSPSQYAAGAESAADDIRHER